MGQVIGVQGIEKFLQLAIEDGVQFACLVADPMVGEPILGEVVGADSRRPVHGAHLLSTQLTGLVSSLFGSQGSQSCAQHAHGLLLVLQLAAFVLTAHDDSGGKVR